MNAHSYAALYSEFCCSVLSHDVTGDKESVIRALASRARRHLPVIRSDLELLEKLLTTYTGEHKKDLIGPRHL